MNTKKRLISSFLILTSMAVNAQTIALTCTSPLTEEYIDQFLKYNRERCERSAQNIADCDEYTKEKIKMEVCKNSKKTYSHKREYIFDKVALSARGDNYSEITNETCWGVKDTYRVKITATPTTISFLEADGNSFNIGRDDLMGGWRTARNWRCDFMEIKRKNKL